MRNQEKRGPEPWFAVLKSFLYGAVFGTAVALVLNTLFDTSSYAYGIGGGLAEGFLTAVIAAPIIEEAVKAGGLGFQRKAVREPEDGIVYGVAIGLGFAATENLLYGATAWFADGEALALQLVAARVLSTMLLHAGVTGLVGYGYAVAVIHHNGSVANILPHYVAAVVLHAGFNLLLHQQTWFGLAGALAIAWGSFAFARRRIRRLDSMPHN